MAVLVEPGKHMARSYRDGAKRTTGQCCKPHLTLVSGTDSHPGIDYFGDPAVVISVASRRGGIGSATIEFRIPIHDSYLSTSFSRTIGR